MKRFGACRGLHAAIRSGSLALLMLWGCSPEVPPPPIPVRLAGHDIVLAAEEQALDGTVPPNGTLSSVLGMHHVASDLVQRIVSTARTAFNPRQLRSGQPYHLVLSVEGLFRSFEYMIDLNRALRVEAASAESDDELRARIVEYPSDVDLQTVRGSIDGAHPSLIAAVDAAGERVDFALKFADLFSGEIDFNSDLQPGDRFDALFEKFSRDDDFVGYGAISAATIENGGRRIQAFRFVGPDGQARYFDENGRSLKRFFLKSPLPFTPRITSRFSLRRLHPVLGVARAHLGVDYAAPSGTPVMAVSDGVVVSAGFSGGSGRMVRLRHGNHYESYYLHLSSIAAGLKRGVRVAQGDVIGRVGASGLATGPHLDYRLSKDGRFVNPIEEHRKLPPGEPVPVELRAAFEAARDEAIELMQAHTSSPSTLARVD
jgi:murein DD-endopeptidase MepM/ murein hydrolase activator NlpD